MGEEEAPISGVFFDMDMSETREITVQKNGYFTVRVNEAATSNGYAWIAPNLTGTNCVDVVDTNYGNFTTGYIQYLFLARPVNAHCTDTITVTRSQAYEDCPGC